MATALVTGNSRGIGVAISSGLRALGYTVPLVARTSGLDVLDAEALEKIKQACANPAIVIHNVGGGGRYGTDDEVFGKNVWAMTQLTSWALPGMLEKKWGRIVTISSIHGREYGSRPIFMAAKAAQIAWMKGMSKNKEYARAGITFNTVCPGNVLVPGKPRVDEEALPMGRMGMPDEVAKLVLFLCSDDAGWINGSCIVIDGGESCAL